MEKLIDLRDLLVHEIMDLYSAEQQIIDGLPAMIEKATNLELKDALDTHLQITMRQKERLDKLITVMTGEKSGEKNDGFFANLFKDNSGHKCKGTEGLIKEAEKMMDMKMTPETMDAAIIGAAQKIEHYEIAGYGTARAYAFELKLDYVANELGKTLDEEYDADDLLTNLAVGKINVDSENASVL